MAKPTIKDSMSAEEFQAYWKKKEASKHSKFKAMPTENRHGEKFRSHLESKFYDRLTLLQRQGDVIKFEREVRFEMIVNEVFICAYVCDFIVYYKDGSVKHIDCKSDATMTQIYKLKKQLMLACHGISLEEVYE